jgi:hypothetical protein
MILDQLMNDHVEGQINYFDVIVVVSPTGKSRNCGDAEKHGEHDSPAFNKMGSAHTLILPIIFPLMCIVALLCFTGATSSHAINKYSWR